MPPRFRGCQVRNAGETYCARQRVVARYGRLVARAPPRAPTLASHSLNVRCKKTYRATQRTNHLRVRVWSVRLWAGGLSLSPSRARHAPAAAVAGPLVLLCPLSPLDSSTWTRAAPVAARASLAQFFDFIFARATPRPTHPPSFPRRARNSRYRL